jgi:hypothetical protein
MAEQAYHNLKRVKPLDASVTTAKDPPRREGMVVWSRNSVVMILARLNARNIIKQDLHDRGIKLSTVEARELTEAASRYLAAHPELLAEASEAVRKDPNLRTLAERHERFIRRLRR